MLHSAACAAAFTARALHCSCSSAPVSPAAQHVPLQRLSPRSISHLHLFQAARTDQLHNSNCQSQHQASLPALQNAFGKHTKILLLLVCMSDMGLPELPARPIMRSGQNCTICCMPPMGAVGESTSSLWGAWGAVEGVVQDGQRLRAAGTPRAQQLPGQGGHPEGAHAQGSRAAHGRHLDGRGRRLPAVQTADLPCRLRRAWGVPGAALDKQTTP